MQYFFYNNNNYDKNGDLKLHPTSATLHMELNGVCEVVLEHPYDLEGRWKIIKNFDVIKTKVCYTSNEQLFRVYEVDKNMFSITIKARHIFFDLINTAIIDTKLTNLNGVQALGTLLQNTKYTAHSDIGNTITMDFTKTNVVKAINGEDKSLVKLFGAEMLFDNFDVYMNHNIGNDYGVKISYARNMTNVSLNENVDSIVTRAIPVAQNNIMLPEKFVDSPLIDKYAIIHENFINLSNIGLKAKASDMQPKTTSLFSYDKNAAEAERKKEAAQREAERQAQRAAERAAQEAEREAERAVEEAKRQAQRAAEIKTEEAKRAAEKAAREAAIAQKRAEEAQAKADAKNLKAINSGNVLYDTEEELYGAMIDLVNEKFDDGLDKPTISGTVDLALLEDTIEYREFKNLVNISIGDIITVEHIDIGIELKTRCVGFEWDILAEKYNSISMGKMVNNVFNSQTDIKNSLQSAQEKIQSTQDTLKNTQDKLDGVFDNSEQLKNALNDLSNMFLSGELLNNPYFNIAVLDTVRNGVKCEELWLLINAKYDYEAKKFKRVNVNNFSFGWQMQGGGTYPGEESIGDLTNQGMNLWKANGKLAYGKNDPSRELTGEYIGATQSDGSWREFGIMLGWNNVFMNDSYGGMTIGGSGFEIDGSGTSPFKRVSLGKFSGGSNDPNKKAQDYVFAYNGTCWNTQHGLWNMDVKETDSFFWGMESPINWYDTPNKTLDIWSNRADLTQAKYVIKRLPPNTSSHFENWENIFEIDCKNKTGKIADKSIVTTTIVKCTLKSGDQNYNIAYPNSNFNKNNTLIVGVKGTLTNGSIKQVGVSATLTDYGIFGYVGDGFESVEVILSTY